MKTFKRQAAELLSPLLSQPAEAIEAALAVPSDPSHGDLAFPCFTLAKAMRKPPAAIAGDLAGSLGAPPGFAKVEAAGGYLNFHVDPAAQARATLGAVAGQRAGYGGGDEGAGRTVVIDFSSPNLGKELAFHHLRGTMIGNSLARVFAFLGHPVVRINHLGDWGTTYGKLLVMYRHRGLPADADSLARLDVETLNSLYKAFAEAAAADPSLEDRAREAFRRLEEGDPESRALWAAFREATLKELRRLYAILGVEFDSYDGEAFFTGRIPEVMDELAAKGLTKESQGATVVDLEPYGMPPLLLRKSDGATLYATRDLAAALYRQRTYGFHKCLYVVDNGQALHFKQFFKVLELMGHSWAKDCEHIPFGLILLQSEDGKWEKGKTRAGAASLLKDVLASARDKIHAVMAEKNPELGHRPDLAQAIGVGALVFNDLKNRRLNDIRFDWDKALSFEGDSGPYVQNAHVRLCSILKKAGRPVPAADDVDFARLGEPQARALVRILSLFPDRVRAAAAAADPCVIAQHALEIAEATHSFLHACRVLGSPEEGPRLLLVDCARQALANALRLLGVPAIEEM